MNKGDSWPDDRVPFTAAIEHFLGVNPDSSIDFKYTAEGNWLKMSSVGHSKFIYNFLLSSL